jgi:hypothetical protein
MGGGARSWRRFLLIGLPAVALIYGCANSDNLDLDGGDTGAGGMSSGGTTGTGGAKGGTTGAGGARGGSTGTGGTTSPAA